MYSKISSPYSETMLTSHVSSSRSSGETLASTMALAVSSSFWIRAVTLGMTTVVAPTVVLSPAERYEWAVM